MRINAFLWEAGKQGEAGGRSFCFPLFLLLHEKTANQLKSGSLRLQVNLYFFPGPAVSAEFILADTDGINHVMDILVF
jgi:hypothetical protein